MLIPRTGQTLSFRHLLTEALSAFLDERGMTCALTADALGELVVTLSRYREEGAPLFPQVFLCDDLASMLQALGGRDPIPISSGPRSKETVRRALKQCAPLGHGAWAIYFLREEAGFSYGVFRTDDFVLSPTPAEVLASIKDPNLKVIGVLQLAENILQLSASAGASHFVHLSGARTDVPPPVQVLDTLVDAATADVPEPVRPAARTFFRRAFFRVMQAPHGALAAVLPKGRTGSTLFADGIRLEPPVDIVARIQAYRDDPREEKATSLQALGPLVQGMMSADGVTVVGSDGCLIAYNVFVQPPGSMADYPVLIGGARRRTYEVLCSYLGTELSAAFYRSQDGHALCRRA